MIKRKSYKKHLKKEIQFCKFKKELHEILEHNVIVLDKKWQYKFLRKKIKKLLTF